MMEKVNYDSEPIYAIIPSEYVSDDCVQIMLGYQNYMMLFGDSKLMYFNNKYNNTNCYENVYLSDGRRFRFPYSSIPEHVELKNLIKKYSVNQILEYGKSYIKISDGLIVEYYVFKNGKNAIIRTKLLSKYNDVKKAVINRKDLEEYLKTGTILPIGDEYQDTFIFENGKIGMPTLHSEQYWLNCEKKILLSTVRDYINQSVLSLEEEGIYHFKDNGEGDYTKIINARGLYEEYQCAIEKLDDLLPFNVMKHSMIKFNDSSIKIDHFEVNYLQKDKYEVLIRDLKVALSNGLYCLESKDKMQTLKNPKINLLLNRGISRQQLKEESNRLLSLKQKSS